MNRSVRNLLSVSVLAPVTALAVAAAPANAAPGPSTTLLYESYAAAAPVAQTLPEPVAAAGGQTAELTTVAVDEALRSAPAGSDARTARCRLNPGKTVNSPTGTSLPDTPLKAVGPTSLGPLPKGGCLGSAPRADRRSAATALPVPLGTAGNLPGAAGDLPGTLLGSLGNLGGALDNRRLGGQPVTGASLSNGRHAEAPLSMPLADVRSALGTTSRAGLPVGTTLFPPAARMAGPGPSDDVLGQANGTVNKVGAGLDDTEDSVGQVVEVLKARNRVASPAEGPVSLLNTAGPGLPGVPGLG